MDHENYGKSGRTSGNADIASGVEDLKVAVELIARETGQQKLHFVGESSGALRAGAYAMVQPERVDRLVFAAFTYKGEGSPTLTKRAEQLDYYRTHNMRQRDRDMIRSIATRDKPGTSDPAAIEALADAEMQFGDQIPTGTYLDMTANLPVVHPEKVLAPVLLVRGEYDGIATVADLEEFYQQAAERRPPVHHPARHRPFGGAGDQPAIVLARDAGVPDHADPDRDVTGRVIPGRLTAEFVTAGPKRERVFAQMVQPSTPHCSDSKKISNGVSARRALVRPRVEPARKGAHHGQNDLRQPAGQRSRPLDRLLSGDRRRKERAILRRHRVLHGVFRHHPRRCC